jgi:hypothetical protein
MDKTYYLTSSNNGALPGDALYSKLISLLSELKQGRANPAQWTGIINGLSQKGVKAAEIEDSNVLEYLKGLDGSQKVEKDDVILQIARFLPRIKCVELGRPRFRDWKNLEGRYKEKLYILSSEAMIADDAIENLMYKIEELGFDPAPLLADPELVDKLEAQMNLLKKQRPEMFDFKHHHFAEEAGNHGKNLMAHSRLSFEDDLMLIEEIQSDWAQNGRASNWSFHFPKAPLVTNTEQWAGAVLRDVLHEAAMTPSVKQVAWIRADMRNGWDRSSDDNLDYFYDNIVRKMAEKCIAKAGGKVTERSIITKHGTKNVLGFDMTDSVREALKQAQPMYSRDLLMPTGQTMQEAERIEECSRVVNECTAMLGSAHTIRFVAKLYDSSFSNEVPGKYVDRAITLSLRAKNLDRAARHESWHFAHENFLLPHEKREMRLAFGYGSELNNRTQAVLRSIGANAAADQCADDKECAAHAFSLWCEGKLALEDEKPKGIFNAVLTSLGKMADWLEGAVFGVKVQTPQQLFEAMRGGALSIREEMAKERERAEETAPAP